MGERLLFLGASPEEAHRIIKSRTIAESRVQVVALRTGLPTEAAVGIRVSEEALVPTSKLGTYWVERAVAEEGLTRAYQPWHPDVNWEHRDRWAGYLDPDFTMTLRNHLDALTPGMLRTAEDNIVEARLIELRVRPVQQTLDLAHLRAVHERLFSDVYPWAGELRTVDMERPNGPRFEDWDALATRWDSVAEQVHSRDLLRGLDSDSFAREAAGVYDKVNTIHAFREGNGRTQREWMNDLARAAGHEIRWSLVSGQTNDHASQQAREGDPRALVEMFRMAVGRRSAAEAAAVAVAVVARPQRPVVHTGPSQTASRVARAMFGTPAKAAISQNPGAGPAPGRRPVSPIREAGAERE